MIITLLVIFFIGALAGHANDFLVYMIEISLLGVNIASAGIHIELGKQVAQLDALSDFLRRLESRR